MFSVTYLGHHGWLIDSGKSRILVDPLLQDGIGNMMHDALVVYPARHLHLDAFPPIDAVVLTHEHVDHFSLPSLCKIERTIPILLSSRTSTAARRILLEMGFQVRLLEPSTLQCIGDLEVIAFAASSSTRDEWDVMPLLIKDTRGDGNFVTSIDAPEGIEMAAAVRRFTSKPGVWVYAYNYLNIFVDMEGEKPSDDAATTDSLAAMFIERHHSQFRSSSAPAQIVILGCGFGLPKDVGWLNRHVFPGNPLGIARALSKAIPSQRVAAPGPGWSVDMRAGVVVEEHALSDMLGPIDSAHQPAHGSDPDVPSPRPDYPPACGRRRLSDEEERTLADHLQPFAEFLYGGPVFAGLLALDASTVAPYRATLGLSLRRENGPSRVFAYEPSGCTFVEVEHEQARAVFVAGIECWATDLVAILTFEIVSGELLLGRVRYWNHAPNRLRIDPLEAMSQYAHPLRHPLRALALYRRTLALLQTPQAPEIAIRDGSRGRGGVKS